MNDFFSHMDKHEVQLRANNKNTVNKRNKKKGSEACKKTRASRGLRQREGNKWTHQIAPPEVIHQILITLILTRILHLMICPLMFPKDPLS